MEDGYASYINFVDFEKVVDSIDRTVIWKLLRHNCLPAICFTVIKNMIEGFTGHAIWSTTGLIAISTALSGNHRLDNVALFPSINKHQHPHFQHQS